MPDLILRVARPADVPSLLHLLSGAGLYTSSVTLEGDVTYWLLTAPSGEVLGAIGLEHGSQATLLRSFALAAPVRGQGLSRRLLDAAYRTVQQRGQRRVYLFSADEGAFWRHQGYVPVPVPELAAALGDAPQVQHGRQHGWLADALAWRLDLPDS